MSNDNVNEQDQIFENLKNSKFKQQKLPAWRPVPTITSTSLTFLFFGIAFIVIGAVVLVYSNKIVEVSTSYSDNDTCEFGTECSLTINVPEDMVAPIMVYYQLNNFYQNHRRYVKSKSSSQLAGTVITVAELNKTNECEGVITVDELGKYSTISGVDLPAGSVANPCGLIAKSFFTDTYKMETTDGTNIFINDTNIAWAADKELKYKRAVDPEEEESKRDPDYWKKVQWIDPTDDHFIVWMRPAGLPNFRKLWGRIETDLKAGNYVLKINNIYDVSKFKGEKFVVLSTVNSFGGKNSFLGISYLVVGSICVVMAIAFWIGYKIHNNKKEN